MERQLNVTNESGLHARPASILVAQAAKFQAEIFIEYDGKRVNAKSILGLMSLGIGKGSQITIVAEGPDEEIAIKALSELVTQGLVE